MNSVGLDSDISATHITCNSIVYSIAAEMDAIELDR